MDKQPGSNEPLQTTVKVGLPQATARSYRAKVRASRADQGWTFVKKPHPRSSFANAARAEKRRQRRICLFYESVPPLFDFFMRSVYLLTDYLRPGAVGDTLWALCQTEIRGPAVGLCSSEGAIKYPGGGLNTTVVEPTYQPPCEPRIAVWPVGPSLYGSTPLVFRSCYHNELQAVNARVASPSVVWSADLDKHSRAWKPLKPLFRELALEVLKDPEYDYEPDVTYAQWVSRFGGSVEQRLSEVRNSILAERGSIPWLNRHDLCAKAFLKIERLPGSIVHDAQTTRKPRLVQGRSDAVKVIMGPWFWKTSKAIARVLNSDSDVFYCSGASAEDLGDWASEAESRGLVPLCYDLVSYDSSIGTAPLGLWAMCCEMMGCPRDLRALMGLRGSHQRGKTRFGIKYTRLGQVSSGDGDTTVGNSVVLATAWRHVLKLCGLSRSQYRVALLGDDSVVAVPKAFVSVVNSRAHSIFTKLGFLLKQDISGDWNTATFCSGFFWQTDSGRCFGPNPGRVLSKTFWTLTNRKEHKQRAWLRGLVDSLRLTTKYVPLLRVLVPVLVDLLGEGPMVREAWRDRDKFWATETHISSDGLGQYAAILDVDAADLAAAELELSTVTDFRVVLQGKIWTKILESVAKGA